MKRPQTIALGNGRRARMVRASPADSAADVIASLDMPAPRGIVVVIGGTAEANPDAAAHLGRQLAIGVAGTAIEDGLTVVSGGTDAGVFALLGDGFADRRPTAPVVGVVPEGRVTWPGRDRRADDLAWLEPHHTHFVLVDGERWGDETPLLLGVVAELARTAPAVVVLASGGSIAKRELVGLIGSGRHVIVLGGSGRLADQVADAATEPGAGPIQSASTGQVEVLARTSTPEELAARIRAAVSTSRG